MSSPLNKDTLGKKLLIFIIGFWAGMDLPRIMFHIIYLTIIALILIYPKDWDVCKTALDFGIGKAKVMVNDYE